MEDPRGAKWGFENQSWETMRTLEPDITADVTQTPEP